jgi:hypothetical protein
LIKFAKFKIDLKKKDFNADYIRIHL